MKTIPVSLQITPKLALNFLFSCCNTFGFILMPKKTYISLLKVREKNVSLSSLKTTPIRN